MVRLLMTPGVNDSSCKLRDSSGNVRFIEDKTGL